ncbi:MAG: hypothetical protein WCR55_13365 [Lentisphaerota bacterium]
MKSIRTLSLLSAMFLVTSLCCASDDVKKADFKDPISLDNAVKLVIADNPNYETAKKNLLQAYTNYFKAVSVLNTNGSSSNSGLNQKENTLKDIIGILDKKYRDQGEKDAYTIIKDLLAGDSALTCYQIMLYSAAVQGNLADTAYYQQLIEDSENSANKSEKDNIPSYKKGLEVAQSELEVNEAFIQIYTEKLANLMGITDAKTIADIKLGILDASDISAKSKDYYLEIFNKNKPDIELKKNFLMLFADSARNTDQSDSGILVDKKYNELLASIAKRDSLKKALEDSSSQRDKIVEEFNSEKADIIALNHAQNKLINSELKYVNSVIEVSKANFVLNFVIGNSNY